MPVWTPYLILLGLVALAALAAGGEVALLSLNPLTLETAARRGNRLARVQQALRRKPHRMLTTLIVATTVFNTALAVYSATVTEGLLEPYHFSKTELMLISTLGVTAILVLVCDLVPKTLGAVRAESFAALVTPAVFLLDRLLTPLHWLIDRTVMPLLRKLTGSSMTHDRTPSLEEVQTLLSLAQAGGDLPHFDVRVAKEALHFSKKNLHDVMTPRVDVIAVADGETVGGAMTAMVQSGFSRLPVYHEDLDEIRGVVLLKDLVTMSLKRAQSGRDPQDEWAAEPVIPHMRPAPRYPGTKGVDEALAELRKERTHLAVVVDEHGGTAGVVTLEDILEELVGDIQDESDSAHSVDVVRRTEGELIVTGRVRLEALPELQNVDLGETESQTLGGLLMERLGRAIVVGDSILLPCKPGHEARIGTQPHDGEPTAQPEDAAAALNGTTVQDEDKPRCTGLRVTALKVLRTRIKLMKVEAVTEELAAAS